MKYLVYGDIEVGLKDNALEADFGLTKLEEYLKANDKSAFYDVPIIGWAGKLLCRNFDARIIGLTGDFISGSLNAALLKETESIYAKLKDNKSLDDKLVSYRKKFQSFDDSAKVANISRIYADLCFSDKLSGIGSVYAKFFKKLEKLGKLYDVNFAFVLGNHDLAYKLFKSRYNNIDNFSHVHFVDRSVKKIRGKVIAGFGGSTEVPGELKDHEYLSNTKGFRRAKRSFLKECENYDVDVLLMHKAYDKPADAKTVWGDFSPNPVVNESFAKVYSGIIKKLNPVFVFCGHWHVDTPNGAGFQLGEDDGLVRYVNPGSRKVAECDDFFMIMKLIEETKKPNNPAPAPVSA